VLTSEGALLDGRLRYEQPIKGFRSGLEPVLLAASVPARAGERILEAGTGAGAALLCLHARVAGIETVGIELNPEMAALASANATANRFSGLSIQCGDVLSVALNGPYDHAIANPPYHPVGTASSVPMKEQAKRGGEDLLARWTDRLASALRPRGTLTLVLPAHLVPCGITALEVAQCGCTVLFPLWPVTGRAAKLVLLRGVKEARTPMRLAAGLVLHDVDGTLTDAAEQILRHADALPLA